MFVCVYAFVGRLASTQHTPRQLDFLFFRTPSEREVVINWRFKSIIIQRMIQ